MKTEHYSINEERFYPSPFGDVPSVTTIIAVLAKPGLIPWAASQAVERMRPFMEMLKEGMVKIEEINIDSTLDSAKKQYRVTRDEGADTGTKMHELIANYYRMIRNGATRLEAQKTAGSVVSGLGLSTGWEAFLKWDAKSEPMPIYIELPVYSVRRYAGRLDFFGRIDDKFYVVDFKSANAIYDETVMQIAGYASALIETMADAKEISGWACLRLDKQTGEPEWREYSADEIKSAFKRFIKLTEYWHLTNDWKQKTKVEKKGAKKNAKAKG